MRKFKQHLTEEQIAFIKEAKIKQEEFKKFSLHTDKVDFPLSIKDNTLIDMHGNTIMSFEHQAAVMLPIVFKLLSKHFQSSEAVPYELINSDTYIGANKTELDSLRNICKEFGHNWKTNVFYSICSRCGLHDDMN